MTTQSKRRTKKPRPKLMKRRSSVRMLKQQKLRGNSRKSKMPPLLQRLIDSRKRPNRKPQLR